ncbi:4-amino-4-deoxy-L-arabinose transferase [Nocardioides sp. Root190]|uniref:uridine kinase family protein n=1 Tax=Nocardioides sp. Root190 TaxID=1736488 RepID=UPI000701D209|nr:4-amino-4-deoxy-L-arabinose transferase [Nocardioides sp. Root190]KRB75783.1 4-amino-4-deoxy-L-arabinose transferase [Nocardioides sp. Root190]
MASPSEASRVLSAALSRPPTLGAGRLICIDGLAGSGKTTLAGGLAALAPEAVVIGTDEMLEGWRGLPRLGASVESLLRPLADNRPGTWRRWDWYADGWAGSTTVDPAPLIVLEGVGSAAAAYDDLITFLVWVEADRGTRLARGLARDGEEMRGHWLTWLDDEAALHAREDTRARADLVLRT